MSGTNDGTAGAESSAGPTPVDPAGQIGALAEVVRQLAASQQAVLEALGRRATGQAAETAPDGATVSVADVRRIVGEVLGQRDSDQRRTAARDRYVREHLADLPDAYRRLVPDTEDPTALAAAERDVRRQYREDLRALGSGPGATVAGDPAAAGERPAAAVDFAGLSPLQQIAVGLRGTTPAGPVVGRASRRQNAGDAGAENGAAVSSGAD